MIDQKNKTPLAAHDLEEGAAKGAHKKTPLRCIFVFDSNALQLGHGWPNTCARTSTESASAGAGGRMGWAAALAAVFCCRFDVILSAALPVSPYGNHGENKHGG